MKVLASALLLIISSNNFPRKYISVACVYSHSEKSVGGSYLQFKLILFPTSVGVSILFQNQKSIIFAIVSLDTNILAGRMSR
jgi:hypothetical protein